MPFVLASSSPRRRELLAQLVPDFTVVKPEIDESRRAGELPFDYAARLSSEKAAAVAGIIDPAADDALILAADTVVALDDAILGKPADAAAARETLRRLRGRSHTVCTAFTLRRYTGTHPPQQTTRAVLTQVTLRNYTDDEIEAYIATGDPFDKAGSYAIQHEGFHPVAQIEGSYSNVVGLPLEALRNALDDLNYG